MYYTYFGKHMLCMTVQQTGLCVSIFKHFGSEVVRCQSKTKKIINICKGVIGFRDELVRGPEMKEKSPIRNHPDYQMQNENIKKM